MCATLTENNKKESIVLQERMSLCTAAQQMAVAVLPTLSGAAVKGNIVMLKDYRKDMPYEMRCAAISRLLLAKLKEICSGLDHQKAVDFIVEWVQCFQMGGQTPPDERVEIQILDVKFPTFRPLVLEMESQHILDTSDGGLFGTTTKPEVTEEDDFFQATGAKQDIAVPEESSHVKDDSRTWEARHMQSKPDGLRL